MNIFLEGAGKKFNRDWIFRRVNYQFLSGQSYAILGANGSGKSTMMQVVSGFLTPSEGSIHYKNGEGKVTEPDDVFKQITFSSPYLELIEEFTLREMLNFHFGFKKTVDGLDQAAIIDIAGLSHAADKTIRHYSSGMKQRVRLSIALLSDTSLVFLDEPLTNLDKNGYRWYRELIERYGKQRTVIVSSNHQAEEYDFCKHTIEIQDYKV